MPKMVHCTFHNDDRASMALYPDGYYCYGCGASGTDKKVENHSTVPPEDLSGVVKYIKSLPLKEIRGLTLHCDTVTGDYYILWPDENYYKVRLPRDNPKYLNPRGHKKPLFIAKAGFNNVAIVEGEINALSVAKALENTDIAVISPGAASDFFSRTGLSYLHLYAGYKKIVIICDKDSAGAIAAIELKSRLTNLCNDVTIDLWEKDANEILVEAGVEKLYEKLKDLGLC